MRSMRRIIIAAAFCLTATANAAQTNDMQIASPNGRLRVNVSVDSAGSPYYSVQLDGKQVLRDSKLGLQRDDADFSTGLKLASTSASRRVADDYTLLTSKRRFNHYVANRRTLGLQTATGQKLDIVFQVSDDGVAFRYSFPETSATLRRLLSEATSFNFLPQTRAWLQPIAVAKSGWASANPSYEEIYDKDIEVGTPPGTGAGWVYPALFRTDATWMLISETALGRNYAGTRLLSTWRSSEYRVGFPDALESIGNGPVNPQSTLPWVTPWRFIVVGTLKTIVESTLGTDLADKPAANAVVPPSGPGKASWSWPLLGDDQTVYDVQKRFIDYAADMGWRYTLIDALWDKQIGYDKIKELADYARTRNVALLLWYNSAGDWNTAPQTPRNAMLTHASRIREFDRLKAMGIAGLKVDFLGGDGQSVIAYYHDILEDSAPYGFLMNFHGATLPRGWQRTYPHLMTMEAVRGLEFGTFEQKNAEDVPTHAAMLPFTRNVFDPMDFTPVVLDRIPRIERRTSSAFELALSVLFTSGIQHYAEIPEGMAKAPPYVRDFMKRVPSIWDDVKFIDGEPGKFVVIARKAGRRWYIAGINGEPVARKLNLSLKELGATRTGTLITDGGGGNLSFRQDTVAPSPAGMLAVDMQPRGGFVIELQ
ncbi:MAG: glycoside hydrolase family 97 catalytic domain-containing protein [Steroidobacteraceae bacterium]